MPRAPRIPSYRCHKPSGRAVCTIGGRDHYLGRFGTPASKAEYGRLIAETTANANLPTPGQHDLTIAELIVKYLAHATAYYRRDDKPTGEASNISNAMRPVRKLYGDTLAVAFGPRCLKAVRQSFIDSGRVRRAINRDVHRIRGMFRWAAAEELLPASVYESIRTVDGLRAGRSTAAEGSPVRPIADELVDAVEPFVSGPVWAMIQLQRLCGMRSGEVTIIRGVDLDMRGRVWTFTPRQHKTQHHGHTRTIDIGPKGQAILTPYLKADATAFLFSPADAERERRDKLTKERKTRLSCGNVVGSNVKRRPKKTPGEVYDVRTYRRAIARACDLAFPPPKGLADAEIKSWKSDHRWHPHQLRHGFGTRIRREYGLEAARAMLGQSTIQAAQIYAEFDRTKCADIAGKIG